ncbi:uncharacterized protein METZ01_LOCUS485624, partial [marine metagenome]
MVLAPFFLQIFNAFFTLTELPLVEIPIATSSFETML